MSSNRNLSINKHHWQWIKSSGINYLRSSLLYSRGFKHGFFSKCSNNKKPQQLISGISTEKSIHIIQQVHGDVAVNASNATIDTWPKGDAIISDQPNQSLWIYTADCIPVMIADEKNGNVAICHSGWKGISNKIILKVIDKLEYRGSRKRNLFFALGPAISGSNYTVNIDLTCNIYEGIKKRGLTADEILSRKLEYMCSLDIVQPTPNANKFKLDIRQAANAQLANHGITHEQITICPNCTFSESKNFHSWRRERIKAHQWSMIISN